MEEEEEVPDSSHDINFLPQTNNFHVNKEKGILGIEDEENMGDFIWDFMEWEDYSLEDEFGDQIKVEESSMFFQEEEGGGNFSTSIKREELSSHGFWDDHIDIDIDVENEINEKKSKSLNLSLNYQQVLDAWSDRGSLWPAGFSLSSTKNGYGYGYTGEVAVTDQEERTRREASVLRYKEKRRSRLFSKKIRYQVRKFNADKRPRLKGRFVKRVPEKIFK